MSKCFSAWILIFCVLGFLVADIFVNLFGIVINLSLVKGYTFIGFCITYGLIIMIIIFSIMDIKDSISTPKGKKQ